MNTHTTTGSDAVDLDKLEAKARAATRGQWYRKTHIQAGILHADDANYMAALDPTTVLALIAQARAAAPVKPTISLSRAGAECMSEDECISQDVDFSAYERGVADAIEACENIVGAARAAAPAATEKLIREKSATIKAHQVVLAERDAEIAELRAALSQQPAQSAGDVFNPCTSSGVEFKNSENLNINDAAPVIAAPTTEGDKQ